MRRLIILGLTLSIHTATVSQTGWEACSTKEFSAAYQKTGEWFTHSRHYKLKLRYSSYKNHNSQNPIESSEGYYERQENNFVSEVMGIRTMQNNLLKLIVDTAEKTVTIMDPGSISPTAANSKELEGYLSGARKLRKAKLANGMIYRIDFQKNLHFEAYEFSMNDKGMMTNLTLYYPETSAQPDTDDSKGGEKTTIKPRLEIVFTLSNKSENGNTSASFSEAGVVHKENGKFHLTKAYKNFRLLDYRYQTKTSN